MIIGGAVLTRRAGTLNPISKLLALVIVAVPLFASTDFVTSGLLVVAELVALPALGIGPRTLVRAGWPILLGLGGIWLASWVVAGTVAGLAPISLRLVALGLPGVLLIATTDPVDLADALVQRWHLSARFAYGALAGFRLLPLLAAELDTMRRARRARGISAGWTPLGWVRYGGGLVFALLVQAIRRGVRLAAAMDSRGFDSEQPRTFARTSTTGVGDVLLVLGTLLVVAAAVAVSVLTGHWRLLFT